MARPISDEELQLKKRARRRLVGAIVLVTAVAVVLPMVLDPEPKSVSQNLDIQIPSPDSGEFKPKGAASASAAADAKSAKPAAATANVDGPVSPIAEPSPPGMTKELPKEPAKTAGTKPPADAAKEPAKTTQAAAAKESREAPGAASGAYVVQVAALSDTAKAKLLEKQMASAGLKTYTEVVNTQSGDVMRVRAGPYPTREAAEKARSQLKKAGLDGKVVPK